MNGQFLVACVADGAGSARFGRLGASVAARVAVGSIVEAWPHRPGRPGAIHSLLSGALSEARRWLEALASRRLEVPLSALATTLIVVIAGPDCTSAIQVGDGVVVIGRDDRIEALTRSQKGEFANETCFLTSDESLERTPSFHSGGGAHGLALMTDGVEFLGLHERTGTAHPPFFRPFFSLVNNCPDPRLRHEKIIEFMRSSRVADRIDDDLTLVVATRLPPRPVPRGTGSNDST